jgi:hypothetical protein
MATTERLKSKDRKNLRCTECMKAWIKDGRKKDKKPRFVCIADLQDGKCPDCGGLFRNHFLF